MVDYGGGRTGAGFRIGKLDWKLGIRNLGWLGAYAPRWTLSCMMEPAVHLDEPRGVALPGMEGNMENPTRK